MAVEPLVLKRPFRRSFREFIRYIRPGRRGGALIAIGVTMASGAVVGSTVFTHRTPDAAPPSTGTANIWVDTNGGTCARSSTARVYSGAGDSASCSSLVAAYGVAANNDLVLIRAGSYGDQNTGPDSSITQCCVTFKPDNGAAVTIAGFYEWGASNTIVDGSTGTVNVPGGFRIRNPNSASTLVSNITLAHMHTETQSEINYATNVTLDDLDIGFWCDTSGSNGEDALRFNDPISASGDAGDPSFVTVKNSRIGNMCWRNVEPPPHPDCVAVAAGNNITFDGNKFYDCGSQGLYVRGELGGNIHDVLIQNNMFGDCTSPANTNPYSVCVYNLWIDGSGGVGIDNIIVRHNSFAVGVDGRPNIANDVVGAEFYGNAGEGNSCFGAAIYHDNVWTNMSCSASDTQANPGFVSNATDSTFDLHLSSTSSPACNHGGSTFPALDFDRESRPIGALAEAGADEKVGC